MKTKPKKYLTEAQAWRKIARAFKARRRGDLAQAGLCHAVDVLWWHLDAITRTTKHQMQAKIRDRCGYGSAFRLYWPESDKKSRVEAALDFAWQAERQAGRRLPPTRSEK